ncbi:hypothetical protein [Bacillus sp. 165]|uniref:hypothetical protein n=1 Tax=Bacillus sp. 165 TaxID=1529117 RepID=UPI001ADC8E95|nr:hypothetical protein [Bacillus sp. 165]MBO9131147.1 hypothetical protein [Bacillus sp. 165]
MYYEIITSPCHGTIEKVAIHEEARIYEWETLFSIQTSYGDKRIIRTSCSGEIQSVEVQEGDKVIPGMVLAYVKEDLFVSGSD